MSRFASYRKRKRAVEKGIEDAIDEGISMAFGQAIRVCADVNPNSSSKHFIRAFNKRLLARAQERAVKS